MPVRSASAQWEGDLKSGKGTMALGSGAFQGAYSFASRFEEGRGTNPEELAGAALAGCFSMALAHLLAQKGHSPEKILTDARVNLAKTDEGFEISSVQLNTRAQVPGVDEKTFQALAGEAKQGCPMSRALAGTQIVLEAVLQKDGDGR
jgi:osmotically inducible protein OsmC